MGIYIGIAVICLLLFLSFLINKIDSKKSKAEEKYPYKLRKFLSPYEHNFYEALKPLANVNGFTIMSKVRLADIVEVEKGFNKSEYFTYFAKIQSKHVDFLLCDKQTVNPLLVIEIDDKSHERQDRIKRDKFVDNLFRTVNLPILHTNNIQTLENQIKEKMLPKENATDKSD